MSIITNAVVLDQDNRKIVSDCFGNNAAIKCPKCQNYPVLLIARPNQRGSNSENPSICQSCGAHIFIISNLKPVIIEVLKIKYE